MTNHLPTHFPTHRPIHSSAKSNPRSKSKHNANLLLFCALLITSFGAFADPISNFVKTPYLAAGSAVLEPSNSGSYVYGELKRDARITSPAIIVSSPVRLDYVFFSAQEESDLWNYKQSQLNAQQDEIDRLAKVEEQTQVNNRYKSIKWPKVVLRGGSVCVPLIDFSDSRDWKAHLTCTDLESIDTLKEKVN